MKKNLLAAAKKNLLTAALTVFFLASLTGCGNAGSQKEVKLDHEDAYLFRDKMTFSVPFKEKGSYELNFNGSIPKDTMILINGTEKGPVPADGKFTADVTGGINSITLKAGSPEAFDTGKLTNGEKAALPTLVIKDGAVIPETGAYLAYDRYEAEDLDTTGTVAEPSREYHSFASEASYRSYVALENEGEDLSLSLKKEADALVIRYCIPDSEDGKGIYDTISLTLSDPDGSTDTVSVPLTSHYSWVYGRFPWTNDPANAAIEKEHVFYDEVRVKLGKVYPAESKLTLTRTSETISEYVLIDLIETEKMGEILPMPENALSAADFGAIPGDEADDAAAIADCIEAAGKQGKEVYIPEGTYQIREDRFVRGIPVRSDGLIIKGAGMWHTTLEGDAAGILIMAENVGLYDFALTGDVTARLDSIDPPAINLTDNTAVRNGSVMQNLWIEHFKLGTWANTAMGLRISGCRIRNTMADGINLCGGSSHCRVEYNDLRNNGDDAIAVFSRGVVGDDNHIEHNSVSLPWLANHIALYGSKDSTVRFNLLEDSVCNGGGVNISSNFSPQPFEGTIIVSNNILRRCGSYNNDQGGINGGIWVNAMDGFDIIADIFVEDNIIEDSTCSGLSFMHPGKVEGFVARRNTIRESAAYGIEVSSECNGKAIISENIFENNEKEEICDQAGGFLMQIENDAYDTDFGG